MIFKSIYSKIKFRKFDSNDDYKAVITWLETHIKRLSRSRKSNLIFLSNELDEDHNVNEFSEQELVGMNPSFDCRTGNRFTRKIHIREIYNKFYSSDFKRDEEPDKNNNKYWEQKKTIRSLEVKDRNIFN